MKFKIQQITLNMAINVPLILSNFFSNFSFFHLGLFQNIALPQVSFLLRRHWLQHGLRLHYCRTKEREKKNDHLHTKMLHQTIRFWVNVITENIHYLRFYINCSNIPNIQHLCFGDLFGFIFSLEAI